MEFRNIIVSNPARLSLRHNQLCILQEQEILIPLEDICTLMLVVTEKQFNSIEILVGPATVYDTSQTQAQLMEF